MSGFNKGTFFIRGYRGVFKVLVGFVLVLVIRFSLLLFLLEMCFMLWFRLWFFLWCLFFRLCSESVANLLILEVMVLFATLFLLSVFETAECGRLLDRGRGGGVELSGVVILFLVFSVGGFVAFMIFVCVFVFERGW